MTQKPHKGDCSCRGYSSEAMDFSDQWFSAIESKVKEMALEEVVRAGRRVVEPEDIRAAFQKYIEYQGILKD